MLYRVLFFLAILLCTGGSTAALAALVAQAKPFVGVVVDNYAVGVAIPSRDSPSVFRYTKGQEVTAQERISADGLVYFKLDPQELFQRTSGVAATVVPALWVEGSHLVIYSEMRPAEGCWPYAGMRFRDGVVDVVISFRSDGRGAMAQSESEGTVAVKVFVERDVVLIADLLGRRRYVLFLDRSGSLSSNDLTDISWGLRACHSRSK